MTKQLNVLQPSEEQAVYDRYAEASQAVEPALCCPVEYSTDLLKAIPDEVLERDYGCGDPSPFVRAGDTVVDLGSGGGKLCFIAAQLVGEHGRIIGVDCNTEMMRLAKGAAPKVAENIGYSNVEFRYGLIQDLKLDLALLEKELKAAPISDASDFLKLRTTEQRLRQEQPLIEDNSVDCVLSNCVLNLVRTQDRQQLFSEIFRVLKEGGRAAVSDIVSDETVPEHLQRDPELWSGCISGAFREDEFLEAFEAAGFHGVEIVKRESQPWQTVAGIEFRSITVVAHKGVSNQDERDCNQAVVYAGPFKSVEDDNGNLYGRGLRTAVGHQTYALLQLPPYSEMFYAVPPKQIVEPESAEDFQRMPGELRDPAETKLGGEAHSFVASGDSNLPISQIANPSEQKSGFRDASSARETGGGCCGGQC